MLFLFHLYLAICVSPAACWGSFYLFGIFLLCVLSCADVNVFSGTRKHFHGYLLLADIRLAILALDHRYKPLQSHDVKAATID
jgi:hypothetical protein